MRKGADKGRRVGRKEGNRSGKSDDNNGRRRDWVRKVREVNYGCKG
jgi:hypothetical protein